MKGPGFRLDLDARRVWECSHCGRRRKLGGDVVTCRCSCADDAPWMQLVEDRRQSRTANSHPPETAPAGSDDAHTAPAP